MHSASHQGQAHFPRNVVFIAWLLVVTMVAGKFEQDIGSSKESRLKWHSLRESREATEENEGGTRTMGGSEMGKKLLNQIEDKIKEAKERGGEIILGKILHDKTPHAKILHDKILHDQTIRDKLERKKAKRALPDAETSRWVEQKIRREVEKLREELTKKFLDDKAAHVMADQINIDRGDDLRLQQEMKRLEQESSRLKLGMLVAILLAICLFLVGFYAVTRPRENDYDDEDNDMSLA